MSGSVSSRSQHLSFVDKITVIHKATSDDESPTPSYLFKEIADISFESIGYSESLAEFLVDRLENKSCNVKLKVLKVMKHVIEHGSKEFQLGLRVSVDSIKEYSKFSGPSHPIHGNVPYVMIRNISKELCEKLYDLDVLNLGKLCESDSINHTKDKKYGGLGPSRSGGAIQGFGNRSISQNKGLGETILEGIEKLGNKMTVMPVDRQAAVLARLNLSGSSSNYQPPVILYGQELSTVSQSKPSTTPVISKVVTRHVPGKAGGGWNDDDEYGKEENIPKIQCIENEDHDKVSCKSIETDSLTDNDNQEYAQTNLVQETTLVDNYVLKDVSVSVGKRPFFSPFSKVQDFILKCQSLNCDCVVKLLSQKLLSQNPHLVARALQAIEGFIYIYHEEELVSIDLLTLVCKTPLVHCFHYFGSAQIQAEEDRSTKEQNRKIWNQVQMKSAKIILILQQLSSHKDILGHSEISKLFQAHNEVEQKA